MCDPLLLKSIIVYNFLGQYKNKDNINGYLKHILVVIFTHFHRFVIWQRVCSSWKDENFCLDRLFSAVRYLSRKSLKIKH